MDYSNYTYKELMEAYHSINKEKYPENYSKLLAAIELKKSNLSSEELEKESTEDELEGIAGWLILVAIGIVVQPFRLISNFGPLYLEIFSRGIFGSLTNPEAASYNPVLALFLAIEIVYNVVMFAVSIWLIFLFFKKRSFFPKLYIIVAFLSIVFIPLDAWLATLLVPDRPFFDAPSQEEFLRVVIGSAIWVPYMLMSKRVKATFKHKTTNKALKQGRA